MILDKPAGQNLGMHERPSGKPLIHCVSFPKSGRTWLEVMIARIVSRLTGEEQADVMRRHRHGGIRGSASADVMPRLMFGHGHMNAVICREERLPRDPYRSARVHLLVRDPRDVVVSHFYHMKYRDQRFDGTLDEFLRYPYQEADPNGPVARFGLMPILGYMNAWVRDREILSELFISSYEDLRADPPARLCDICAFCGITVDEDLIQDAVSYGSFEHMLALDKSGDLDPDFPGVPVRPEARKVRKGQVGGYRQEMTAEQIEFADDLIDRHLDPFFDRYQSRPLHSHAAPHGD